MVGVGECEVDQREKNREGVSFIYPFSLQPCTLFSNFLMKALEVVNSASLAGLFSALRGRLAAFSRPERRMSGR